MSENGIHRATTHVNGIRLYYEEQGRGARILCMHETGTSASVWGDAAAELARLGHVIAYSRSTSRRRCSPSPCWSR